MQVVLKAQAWACACGQCLVFGTTGEGSALWWDLCLALTSLLFLPDACARTTSPLGVGLCVWAVPGEPGFREDRPCKLGKRWTVWG